MGDIRMILGILEDGEWHGTEEFGVSKTRAKRIIMFLRHSGIKIKSKSTWRGDKFFKLRKGGRDD